MVHVVGTPPEAIRGPSQDAEGASNIVIGFTGFEIGTVAAIMLENENTGQQAASGDEE